MKKSMEWNPIPWYGNGSSFPISSVREMVQHYGSSLPVLAKVKDGYAGEVDMQYTLGQVGIYICYIFRQLYWSKLQISFLSVIKKDDKVVYLPLDFHNSYQVTHVIRVALVLYFLKVVLLQIVDCNVLPLLYCSFR